MHYAGAPETPEYVASLLSHDKRERAKSDEIRSADELRFFCEVFERWREESEKDLSTFAFTRRSIAAAAARADSGDTLKTLLRDHQDQDVRIGYYSSFRPVDPAEVEQAFKRDKDAFVEAAIENEYFYRVSVPQQVRSVLEKRLDKIPHE